WSIEGWGQTTGGAGRSVEGAGHPRAAAGQPAAGADQPVAGADQPTAGADQPTAGADQPTAGAGQPTAGAGQPTAGAGQSTAGAGQSTAGAGQSTAGAGQSTAGAGQFTAAAGPSPAGAGQSTAGPGQSTAGPGQSNTAGSPFNTTFGPFNTAGSPFDTTSSPFNTTFGPFTAGAGQIKTAKPGEPVERQLSGDQKLREWSLDANVGDDIKRIKVCRVEDVCKMRFKEGETPRMRVRNLVVPLRYEDENIAVSEAFTRQVQQTLDTLRDKRGLTVRFIGYTDNAPLTGRDEQTYGNDVSLSKARAQRIALAMQEKLGLPVSAIESDGRGATRPV